MHDRIEKVLNLIRYVREPLQNIIRHMIDKHKCVNGDSIERHNFGDRPCKLNNIPDYNQMNENRLYEILKK